MADTHPPAASDEHPTDDEHADAHALGDHGHADVALGPIDVPAWGAAAVGVLLGLVVVLALVQSLS